MGLRVVLCEDSLRFGDDFIGVLDRFGLPVGSGIRLRLGGCSSRFGGGRGRRGRRVPGAAWCFGWCGGLGVRRGRGCGLRGTPLDCGLRRVFVGVPHRTGGTGSLPWGSGPALRGRRFRFCWDGRDRHRSEGDAVARGDGQRKRSRTPPSFGKAVEESAR